VKSRPKLRDLSVVLSWSVMTSKRYSAALILIGLWMERLSSDALSRSMQAILLRKLETHDSVAGYAKSTAKDLRAVLVALGHKAGLGAKKGRRKGL
jgi:hypothetical protein